MVVKNNSGYTFATHIANFSYPGFTGLSSAFFGTQKTTLITLSSLSAKASNAHVKLNWETESEIDNVSFNIYRSETEMGTYMPINAELIPQKALQQMEQNILI